MLFEEIDNKIKKFKHLSMSSKYIQLINIYEKSIIDFYMYDTYKYIHIEPIIDNNKDDENDEIKKKRNGQSLFRTKLIERYNSCVISGCSYDVCDAAHIIPYAELDSDCYNIDNGILLRQDLHTLFDKKKLTINPNTLVVIFDEDILKNNKDYLRFNNLPIDINLNSIEYLKKFYILNEFTFL